MARARGGVTLRLWLCIGAMWLIVAAVLGPGIGAFIRHGAREMPPAPVDPAPPGQGPGAGPDPPEWEPGDDEAQRIAEVFADSAQEGPLFEPSEGFYLWDRDGTGNTDPEGYWGPVITGLTPPKGPGEEEAQL
jgi:hypothetical protein